MNKHTVLFLFPALLLAACLPVSNGLDSVQTPGPVTTPTSPATLLLERHVIIHSASYSILVEQPARAVNDLQLAVEKAGGYVVSVSSWSSEGSPASASLSARVPPESLSALRQAVDRIADEIQNESTYVQDVTQEYRKLHERREELTRTREHLWQLLIESDDLRMESTYRVVSKLLDNELDNIAYQLDSYDSQAELANLNVSFNESMYLILE